jgi:DNA-binding NarL/FixJ family response regulator
MVSADVREELGLALAADLHPDAPAMLTDAVEAAEEPAQRTRIALSAARAAGLQGNFDLAISLCRTGLQDQGATTTDHGTTALEVELAVLSTLNAATADEAARLIGRHAGDAPVLELWRIVGALLAATRGDPGPSDRGVLRAAVLGDVLEREPGTLLMTAVKVALIGCGDLELVDELCTRQIGAARSRGWVIALAHAGFLRAIVRVQTGRIRDAEADARQSFEYKLPVVPPPAIYWSLAPLVDALVELDAPADAEAALASVAHYGEPAAGAWSSAMVLESRARLHGAQGRPADALADAERAGSTWSAVGIANPALAAWRVTAAEALLRLGDRASAARRAAEHLALARQLGAPGPLIAGLRVSALAAGGADEIALLEEAVVTGAASSSRLEHVRAMVDLGVAYRRCGRQELADVALRGALDLASRGGMVRLAARCRAELHAGGARPRRDAVRGVGALTPSEHRIAVLAAQGLSNPEIAQQLYVTRRTVETHLTHVFQKLHVTSRADLAQQLAEPEPVGALGG